jgi:ubiquitin-like 1-activating enzyme E1 A
MSSSQAGGMANINVRRTSRVYLILRIVAEFEKRHSRLPTSSTGGNNNNDVEEMKRIAKEQGLPHGAVDDSALMAYIPEQQSGDNNEMPAVNAIVGGILANAVLSAVSRKGEPLNNLFCFSLLDGMGMVETVGYN